MNDIILKKIWCHGQLVLPMFGVFYLYWSFREKSIGLAFAGIVLPFWSMLSYRAVFVPHKFRACTFWIGAGYVQTAHLIAFLYFLQSAASSSGSLLLVIASVLFFIETLAFLLVFHNLGPQNLEATASIEDDYRDVDTRSL